MMCEGESSTATSILRPLDQLLFDTDFTNTGTSGITFSCPSGDVVVQTTVKKFGTGAVYRAAQTSTAGVRPASAAIDYTKDFTILLFFARLQCASTRYLFISTAGTTLAGIRIILGPTGVFTIEVRTTGIGTSLGDPTNTSYETTDTTFHHLAITHIAATKTVRMHIDGRYCGESTPWDGTIDPASTLDLLGDGGTTAFCPSCYIDDFTHLPYAWGEAADMAVPTEPF